MGWGGVGGLGYGGSLCGGTGLEHRVREKFEESTSAHGRASGRLLDLPQQLCNSNKYLR